MVSSKMVLAGTDTNCAGGVLDDAWISCEESSEPGHGYAFVTRPEWNELSTPEPIFHWGRFHREAVARDPSTGTIYMTEDRSNGCFYRFIPEDRERPFGPGTLQALCIEGVPTTHPYTPESPDHNGQMVSAGRPPGSQSPTRKPPSKPAGSKGFKEEQPPLCGAKESFPTRTAFGSLPPQEDTKGRPNLSVFSSGAIPGAGAGDRRPSLLSCPDNFCIAPWGDLICAEDNYAYAEGVTHQHLRG